MKCWAKSVSECCATQLREHYITKGLFSGKMLDVDGAPFSGGCSREVYLTNSFLILFTTKATSRLAGNIVFRVTLFY
jgi:hypothetical protein